MRFKPKIIFKISTKMIIRQDKMQTNRDYINNRIENTGLSTEQQ